MCFTLSFTLVGNFRLHMCQSVSEEKHTLSLHTKDTGISRAGYGQWLESEWVTGHLLKDCALLVNSLKLQVYKQSLETVLENMERERGSSSTL